MLFTFTVLIVTWFSPPQLTVVSEFKEPVIEGVRLSEPDITGIPLGQENLTIVKTWKVQ